MSLNYNPRARLVTSADVDTLTLLNVTTVFNGDQDNGYVYEGYHTAAGCGGPESGIQIILKDNISWSRISFLIEVKGQASCWSFTNATGNYGAGTGNSNGNLLEYNEALGDRVYEGNLTFTGGANIGGYSPVKLQACDNNADNFLRYNTNVFRKFRMARRRNVGAGLAGIHHGRSCNETGPNNVTRISNIFIW